jgi:hypothetical protein
MRMKLNERRFWRKHGIVEDGMHEDEEITVPFCEQDFLETKALRDI